MTEADEPLESFVLSIQESKYITKKHATIATQSEELRTKLSTFIQNGSPMEGESILLTCSDGTIVHGKIAEGTLSHSTSKHEIQFFLTRFEAIVLHIIIVNVGYRFDDTGNFNGHVLMELRENPPDPSRALSMQSHELIGA